MRLLKGKFNIAALSRGYKRQTSGFIIATDNSTSFHIGDEPLQFKKKFPDVTIAVDEKRVRGIKFLLRQFPQLNVILLDDAFQHRSVKAGLSILLSDYGKMFYDDFLLPAGTLREWRSEKKRADIIIVTKCPANLSAVEKRIIQKKINPEAHQHVFFSYLLYGISRTLDGTETGLVLQNNIVILLAGISNPRPLEELLKKQAKEIIPQYYPDHHQYSLAEILRLKEIFENISSKEKIIITTEKDAMRLDKPGLMEILRELPVFYLPIEITFDEKEKSEFDQIITEYVNRTNQTNSSVFKS
jgi:tetraacyldisaccharide 4'-kinase